MAESVAVGPRVSFPREAWIQSPAWDLFWMFSAFWGAVLLLAGSAFVDVVALTAALFAGNTMLAMCHAWSTTYVVLWSPLMREQRRSNVRLYGVYPALIAVFGLALGIAVAVSQRFPVDGSLGLHLWPFMLYILLFWVGHFWHFGNQDFGVLNLYRMRAGQDTARDRKLDRRFAVTMMFVLQPIVYVYAVSSAAFSEIVRTYVPFLESALSWLAPAAVAGAAVLTVLIAALELAKPNRSIPKLMYYGVMLFHPVFLYASIAAGSYRVAALYVISYLWSHWLIAIGLVARINTGYYEREGDAPTRAFLRHAAAVGGIAIFLFLLTVKYTDYHLFNLFNYRYKEVLAGISPEQALLIGCFMGYFLSEQLLHYYCDRRLFRLRDPGIRATVGPLVLRRERSA